jgi:DNA-directed RNA polymerase specialized sigma24 family protein
MEREERFDSFYSATRHRILLQAFALTGDLPAAQAAVKDAYVEAWHHWRKVSRLDDPTSWVRPRAWAIAQRRHTARIWRRNKGLSDEHRRVLDALTKLSTAQRRAFLLVQLGDGVPLADASRELGALQDVVERSLQSAIALLTSLLDTDASHARVAVESLGQVSALVTLPRASIVRRAGRQRRQGHTLVATVAAIAVVLAAGAATYAPNSRVVADLHLVKPTPTPSINGAAATLPTATQLLTADQISRLGLGQTWRVESTSDNTAGTGINTVCQQTRFADPRGLAALVRTFLSTGRPTRKAVQTIEISRTAGDAEKAFSTELGWYAGCQVARLQILKAYQVTNIGDEASLMILRVWSQPVTTYSVAVARIGDVTTTTVGETVGASPPPNGEIAQSLADSVAMLCGRSGSAGCQKTPTTAPVPPPPSGDLKGILAVVDLPPAGSVDVPWVGTKPVAATVNPARTTCDKANFAAANATTTLTRTYLLPGVGMPARFGLTESYGVFSSDADGATFMRGIAHNVTGCEKRDLATKVSAAWHSRQEGLDARGWQLATKVHAHQTVHFRIGFVRYGDTVAELTFVSAPGADFTARSFHDLVLRAGDRLREL